MHAGDYKLLKVFNNNVVLTCQAGVEKIVIKQGMGFGKHIGDIIDGNTVFDKVFILERAETRQRFNQLLKDIDGDIVGICEEIIFLISSELDDNLDEEIHIRLTDHIAFTLYRIKRQDEIRNPFLIEIETLYPCEMQIAKKTINLIEARLGITIPQDEAGFIALHIHTAKERGQLSTVLKYASIYNEIVELIEGELHVQIDRKSIDYARFVSHIRFALERMVKNIPIRNELLMPIIKTYKESYKLSGKIAGLIEHEFKNVKVSKEEIGYMAMHIERLKNNSRGI